MQALRLTAISRVTLHNFFTVFDNCTFRHCDKIICIKHYVNTTKKQMQSEKDTPAYYIIYEFCQNLLKKKNIESKCTLIYLLRYPI